MLTIRVMVRVGPWLPETVEKDDDWSHCERCDEPIKEIWTCTVDADWERLGELDRKRTWRIGSTCGPTRLKVSDEAWKEAASPIKSRIRLALRVQGVLNCEGLHPGVRQLLLGRVPLMLQGVLDSSLQRHLATSRDSAWGRRLRLWT